MSIGKRWSWGKAGAGRFGSGACPMQLAIHNYLNAITPNNPSNPLFGPAVKKS
jgi:hypothetical protein